MALVNLSPTTRVWLDIENNTVNQKSDNTGQIGQYLRGASNFYTDETILQFDLTSLVGATVTDVDLDFTISSENWPGSINGYLYDQNKTVPGSWSTVPRFDDFAQIAWSTELDNVSMGGTGTYTFNSASLDSLVQDWIDDSDDNWGVIIGANPSYFGYYGTLSTATLKVTYTAAVTAKPVNALHHYKMRRR